MSDAPKKKRNTKKKPERPSRLCRYVLEFGRSADLEGTFVASPEVWEELVALSGSDVYYGEISGKHSDVRCEFDIADIVVVSENPQDIEVFTRLFPEGVGFPFLEYFLDADEAAEAGARARASGDYSAPEDALAVDYRRYATPVMREQFLCGWNEPE